MRRLILFISLICVSVFSLLYNKKDAEIHLYSELCNMYINLNEETFKLSIYLNVDKSIYSNMNTLKIKYTQNESNFSLNVKSFNAVLDGNYYRYDYEIYNTNQFEGLYKDFTLNFQTSYTNQNIVFGNYYFSNNEITQKDCETYYDTFGNINKVKLGPLSDFDLTLVKDINKIKPSDTSFLSEDDLNLYLYLDSSYHNKNILINYADTNYYLISDLKLNTRFLKEIK